MTDIKSNTGHVIPALFPGFVSFVLSTLIPETQTPCDVFFEAYSERLGRNSLIPAMKKGQLVEIMLLDDLTSQGVVYSYTRQEDLDSLQEYLFRISSDNLSGLSKEKRIELLYQSALCTLKSAMMEPRNGRRLSMGLKVVHKLVDTLWEDQQACIQLLNVITVDKDLFVHSIKTCLLGAGFAQFLGWTKSETKELAIALFFHDLGLVVDSHANRPNPLKIDLHVEAEDRDHPTRSRDYLTQLPDINPRILDTVQNHHETLDTSGYPRGLGANHISQAARVARIIDFYELQTSGNDDENTPYVALKMMNIELAMKLDQKLVQDFIVFLGRF